MVPSPLIATFSQFFVKNQADADSIQKIILEIGRSPQLGAVVEEQRHVAFQADHARHEFSGGHENRSASVLRADVDCRLNGLGVDGFPVGDGAVVRDGIRPWANSPCVRNSNTSSRRVFSMAGSSQVDIDSIGKLMANPTGIKKSHSISAH
jgi:hypothetical protein